jgi:hypothetical protein
MVVGFTTTCAISDYHHSPIFDQSFDILASEMGENGQLFPLTDNTDGTAVDQVQQQYLLSLNYIQQSFFAALINEEMWSLVKHWCNCSRDFLS